MEKSSRLVQSGSVESRKWKQFIELIQIEFNGSGLKLYTTLYNQAEFLAIEYLII